MTTRCRWCGKERASWSGWEQEHLSGGWSRLCSPCARKRLDNPWSALLPMRQVATARADASLAPALAAQEES